LVAFSLTKSPTFQLAKIQKKKQNILTKGLYRLVPIKGIKALYHSIAIESQMGQAVDRNFYFPTQVTRDPFQNCQ
jgi:hypothetical protein